MLVMRVAEARWEQGLQRSADHFLRGVAEDLFGSAVEVDDGVRLVNGDDGVRRNREDARELRKVMAEMEKKAEKYKDQPMPFDPKRMSYGGFKVQVSS